MNKDNRKLHIISSIDPSDYDTKPKNNSHIELISWAKGIMLGEVGHHSKQLDKVAEHWLSGLATACSIEYRNSEIMILLKQWGELSEHSTDDEIDRLLSSWFSDMGSLLADMMSGMRVPDRTLENCDLSDEDVSEITYLLTKRCRGKTITRVRSCLKYSLDIFPSWARERIYNNGMGWQYCAGQDYPSEIATIRKFCN